MADSEKVFDALRNCVTEPKFFPWEDCEKVGRKRVKVPISLLLDTLNVLREQPEQKHGRWIIKDDTHYTCSCCGAGRYMNFIPNYCSECGARMDEEVEQDENIS